MDCSRCKLNAAREGQRLCRECHAANMRAHRAGRAGELETLRAEVAGLHALVAQLRSELMVARALGAGMAAASEAYTAPARRRENAA